MKEAFKIAEESTKKKRSTPENKRPENNFRAFKGWRQGLSGKFNREWGPGKIHSFWEQKIYRIKEKKGKDGLVYAVVGEDNPKSRVRALHRNHFLS